MEGRRFQPVALMLIVGLTFLLNWSFSIGGQTQSPSDVQQLITLVQNLEEKVDQIIVNQDNNAQVESLQETVNNFLDGDFRDLKEAFKDFQGDAFDVLSEIAEVLGLVCSQHINFQCGF